MYSPAAYFTDILNFIRKRLVIGSSTESKPYTELIRRRPDLLHIDLSCKNANTPLPYIDLVNELLELMILRKKYPAVDTPLSYQTSGTAQELNAYPEHTVKNGTTFGYEKSTHYEPVYDVVLKDAIYPNNIPLDLPLEESRVYLTHLGHSRSVLMERFMPASYASLPPGAQETYRFNLLSEQLGVSRKEALIICDTVTADVDAYRYYGFDSISSGGVAWYNQLCNNWAGGTAPANSPGLGLLLERTNISYAEMLQLLDTRFLNPFITTDTRAFQIISVNASSTADDQDTCDLKMLKIVYTSTPSTNLPDLFGKLHRFIRLYRAMGLRIRQLDMMLASFGATDIDGDIYQKLVRALLLARTLKTSPERLSSFWSSLSTVHYINYEADSQSELPSVYDSLFRNKSVFNPPSILFDTPGAWNPALVYTEEHKGTIMAAANITEEELVSLFRLVNNQATPSLLTLPVLSRVYAIGIVARGLDLSIKDCVRIGKIFQISLDFPGNAADAFSKLIALTDAAALIKGHVFSLDELEYLVAHRDEQSAFTPPVEDIALFYSKLRTDLRKLAAEEPVAAANGMGNMILRQFSTTFNLDTSLVSYLLKDVLRADWMSVTVFVYDALTNSDFINSSGSISPSGDFASLFYAYIRMHKIAMVVNRLRLSTEEFRAVQPPISATPPVLPGVELFGFPQFASLPVLETPDTSLALGELFRLLDWVKVRDQLFLNKEELQAFWSHIIAISPLNGIGDVLNHLSELAGWSGTDLQFLLGSGNLLGVNDQAPDDFVSARLFLKLLDIFQSCTRIGLAPELVNNVLTENVQVADARRIREAAKAKHTDEEWQKIAKPLQDALREKQRKALVAYIIANPDMADLSGQPANNMKWKNEHELYAYLLIDVEMQPCMKTSRLKQAISSLQLFLDRVILNLENSNGSLTDHIYMTTDQTEQWRTWRKWYRIWEANRKIFLYPENWIEPELRDDKTPFFKELETQLLQDDITGSVAEDALKAYLEKLDEVARLEPMSGYHEVEKNSQGVVIRDIMHVFARTNAQPHRYFYRKLEDNAWSPWEKVNVDVKGDHVVPVVWNRRVYIFWLTFTQKTTKEWYNTADTHLWVNRIKEKNDAPNVGVMTIVSDANEDDKRATWDVRLNWTQYKDGKWLASEVCEDVMNINPARIRLTPAEYNSYNSITGDAFKFQFLSELSRNGELKLADLFKARLFMTPHFESGNQDKPMILSLNFFSRADDKGAITLLSFKFPDPVSKPFAERAWEREYLVLSPINTQAQNMKFKEVLPQPGNAIAADPGKLKIESVKTYTDPHFSYFYKWYKGNTAGLIPIKRRDYGATAEVLLNDTPLDYGPFSLTKIASAAGADNASCIKDYFFFQDEVNTFYVRRRSNLYTAAAAATQQMATLGNAVNMSEAIYGTGSVPVQVNPGLPLTGIAQAGAAMMVQSSPSGFTVQNNNVQQLNDHDYYFQTFYHAQIHRFMKSLHKDGVPGLLTITNQSQADTLDFGTPGQNNGKYKPTSWVNTKVPRNNVQFRAEDPYSIYNWELFFHAPMLIAQRLSDNQNFEEAQQWYHYIFNPTSSTGMNGQPIADKRRFWKFYPFYEQASGNPQTLQELLQAINDQVAAAEEQVRKWEKNPFQPHVIARLRVLAYMKNVVMKYIDNLIAWGDQLFRRDTIESINEGTQLYILAANILGKRPESIPPRVKRKNYTFDELLDANASGLDMFSNGMVNIEAFYGPNTGIPTGTTTGTSSGAPVYGRMSYFCLPKNDKLMGYWDTVADRLFKIRNCMNIEGVVRELPLYEPPVDPALLVRAAALGIDTDSLLDTVGSQDKLSYYRFAYTLQKANEICNDVRGLGSSLLSALEKKDAEELSLLRSGQELRLLEQMTFVREGQLREAEAGLEAMQLTRDNTQQRYDYYSSRPFMNAGEQRQLQSMQMGVVLNGVQAALQGTVGALAMVPTMHLQALASGTSFGGTNMVDMMNATSTALGIAAIVNSNQGAMAGISGGYQRRQDDWDFQAASAQKELEQLDRQILAAQVRIDIARRELANHELQIENTRETDAYMRSKFTNKELYSWMVNQIAATYFQSYQLAYDMAKKAEACFRYELPLAGRPVEGFITFGYWDSLRKGLMSGDRLQFDLRKMETAYMEGHQRELELSKNISLAIHTPEALLQLQRTGSCTFRIPEELFDLDYPGHFLRRIKSVSLSIPCIAGPYTTIAATLALGSSKLRMSGAVADPETDSRLSAPIATSTGQNDSGVFELNFRDERYLPFEGRGAIDSEWTLTLAQETQLRMFDFSTISDVLLHLRYTAREGSVALRTNRIGHINNLVGSAPSGTTLNGKLMPRYFSLKHEYSAEWFAYSSSFEQNPYSRISLSLDGDAFPYYTAGKKINVDSMMVQLKGRSMLVGSYKLKLTYSAGSYQTQTLDLDAANGYKATASLTGLLINGNVKLLQVSLEDAQGNRLNMDELLDDLYLVAYYHLAGMQDVVAPQDDQPEVDMPLAGISGWWKADAGDNVLDDGELNMLTDQSGNGLDLLPYGATQQPVLVDAHGVKSLLFQESILYNGSNTAPFSGNDDLTVFSFDNTAQGRGFDAGAGNTWSFQLANAGLSFVMSEGGEAGYTLSGDPFTAPRIKVAQLTQSPVASTATASLRDLNKVDIAAPLTVPKRILRYTSDIGFVMGASGSPANFVDGSWYETLIYRRALNDQEVRSVLAYLKGKYPFAV